jgi:hypothetical protein
MLNDMGYKDKNIVGEMPTARESQVRYPSICLSENVPDDLFDKEVGSTCRIEVIVKITSKGMDERDGQERRRMDLEIHKLGYIANSDKKSKEEYLSMDENSREKYDEDNLKDEEKPTKEEAE